MKFSVLDIDQMRSKNIDVAVVERQVAAFANGFPYLPLLKAATIGDGIVRLSSERASELSSNWDKAAQHSGLVIEKFVPASGAATRMFKEYFEFLSGGKASTSVRLALDNIKDFAFYDDLMSVAVGKTPKDIVEAIIAECGLDYGKKPKALLKFHKYTAGGRTAFEEHLVEGALYGSSIGGPVRIHFTVSPEHRAGFDAVLKGSKERLEQRFGIRFEVSYSEQKPSTDTIAVELNNEPFRNDKGELVFRPAGHGALIENLADIASDVVFIKTVDNVLPDNRKNDTVRYKKALAALGVELQGNIFGFLRSIDSNSASLDEMVAFIESNIGYRFAKGAKPTLEQVRSVLNRPLRICGMVLNEGEPGGGPFWVKGDDGSESLQIAESSQISPEQKPLMQGATHFNPVDLVCFAKDYKGKKFDLAQYIDPATGFISQKSIGGKDIKALELPGLWNGAMAKWNTVFVEVPITTFAPVKVLTDLLRSEHQ